MTLPEPNGNVIDQHTGGGCASLIGLPFFLAGLGVIVVSFIPPEIRGGDPISPYFGIPFGSLFVLIGGAILFGRMNLRIDRDTGLIRKQWKALGLIARTQKAEIKVFDKISVTSEVRRSKNSSYTVYPIKLLGAGDETFDISQSRNELEARKETEQLSKFLSLPIHDWITGTARIREADSLDQSVKDKFKTGATSNEIPEPPFKLKSKVRYDGIIAISDSQQTSFGSGLDNEELNYLLALTKGIIVS